MGVAQPRIRVSLPEVRHNLCPKKKNNGPCVVVWRLMNSPSHSPLDGQKERRAASRGELWVLGPEHCANPVLANQTPGHSSAGDPVPVGGSVMNVVAVAVDRWSCELIAMAARVKLWKWTCTASLSTTTS
jgi:hypothetical protein